MATKNVFSSRATMFRTVIAAAVCAASVVSPTLADVNITEDVVLDADADWRGQGVVTMLATAKRLLANGKLMLKEIADCTGLSLAQVKKLQVQMELNG